MGARTPREPRGGVAPTSRWIDFACGKSAVDAPSGGMAAGAKQTQKCQKKRGRAARKAAMNLVDDGLDKIKNQSDQLEARILEQDRYTDQQTRRAILPLRVGWAPARRPAS